MKFSSCICISQLYHKKVIPSKNILENISPFRGITGTPVLVSKSGCILYLHTSSPVDNGFLRFIAGATSADLLATSTAADPIYLEQSNTKLFISYEPKTLK